MSASTPTRPWVRSAPLTACLLALCLARPGASAPVRYVVGTDSQVRFKAASNLHGFHGGTDAVTGSVTYDPAAPLEATGEVVIDPASLRTGDGKRDAGMRSDALEVSKFPAIRMTMRRFVPHVEAPLEGSAAGTVTGNIHGTLALHGVSRNLLVPAQIEPVPGGGLRVQGAVGIDMTNWEIVPPRTRKLFVTLSVLPNVSVSFDLRLAPQPVVDLHAAVADVTAALEASGPLAGDEDSESAAAARLKALADSLRARQGER